MRAARPGRRAGRSETTLGILVDAELETVPNELYRMEAELLDAEVLGPRFLERASAPSVGLALGRVSIRPDRLFEEAILKVLHRVPAGEPPPITASNKRGLRRTIFRGSVGSDYGKRLRWNLETRLGTLVSEGETSRNSELSEAVDVYANHDPSGTDILHEYFVPHSALAEFLRRARPSIEAGSCDLLNVTVRDVHTDTDTFLRYADTDVFALVTLFHQKRTSEAEEDMRALTEELIDVALALGGRYYLPYRRHATPGQFERAYPMAREFFAAKLRYDPQERFTNRFYRSSPPGCSR